MVAPDFERFEALAKDGSFIPVYREILADLETPVSAWYRVCAGARESFLLESVEGGERLGRYSFLGCEPLWTLAARGDACEQTFRDGGRMTHRGDPFAVLDRCLEPYRPVHLPELPPGIGGLFGYWGYELIRWIEPTVPVYSDPDGLPDGFWMQVDSLLIFDQIKRKIWVIAYADLRESDTASAYRLAGQKVDALVDRLARPAAKAEPLGLEWTPHRVQAQSTFSREQYCGAVERAREYIRAGDIFQVVLAQRFSTPFAGESFDLYRMLRAINPSPYMAYYRFGDFQLIGSSPEVMVRLDRRDGGALATVRPIAGTRRRGQSEAEDRWLEKDLLADPKEVAEHVMLVDLGRNDLGRVCKPGSVRVDELLTVERYSHVMHIVSNVTGELAPGAGAWDLLRATFPAGTVSGAPKIRAMEIIHELEPFRRGPYAGAYGYYSFDGQLNTAITIRTLVVHGGLANIQAGAGLVADSVPESEYEETLNKACGMLETIARLSRSGGTSANVEGQVQ
ncbi:MAG: anthranilate synthase component I [Aphanocapsa lilacina HA4352-LM1]|jgi:anthranilate synthase component 1|nr:anthranilate synthase component I [Aphanocapsa lilacina HA4352-LM1]